MRNPKLLFKQKSQQFCQRSVESRVPYFRQKMKCILLTLIYVHNNITLSTRLVKYISYIGDSNVIYKQVFREYRYCREIA